MLWVFFTFVFLVLGSYVYSLESLDKAKKQGFLTIIVVLSILLLIAAFVTVR